MHALNWFEIPCSDLNRAAQFYDSVLEIQLKRETFMDVPHAIFGSSAGGAVGGALVQDKQNAPSAKGTLVYLDASGKLDACLARVTRLGGEVLLPKTDISPNGFIAILRDTEGNRVGLHSRA
jgi:predicted enzyme related to lactoylglutathione lyase